MKLGFIGCGGISIAHVEGLEELKKKKLETFELSAVCDIQQEKAENFALEVEKRLGKRPTVYTDYRVMLEKERLNAVSVLINHNLHHIVAEDCFAAGVHVQMQKPLAISPSFGRKIIADAKKYNRVLTLCEPSVLGAENVAIARAVKEGVIGSVYLVMDYATVTLNRGFFAGTPWRHMKGEAGAGWINDHGVHRTHFFTEINGPIDEVFAYTEIFEKELSDGNVTISPTGEDTAVTVFKFKNGGLGHWMCATSAHGERTGGVWIYGNKGCLRPGQHVTLENGKKILMTELIERYASDIVEHPFAHSFVELWEAIAENKIPISSAERGLEALGVVFAALESATIGQPVKVQDIINGKKRAYEDTVIEEMKSLKVNG
ncbi:putative dehydrogenase [Anoxybacillus voinovskiensis]|uniref:Putative dehydrogenase n=1 Tax=Anoxybacteroides voinovskiense TaxID=230470 RepID=A0A840DN12_9BACL|nr:Gfo/Idh/MocA family oxidoreductase [Anoxybacillus voinovskiensis]MBB4073053.1 putative dehydrogenase [Anoxybacillus voinovskiensis]GGJ59843.1 oxidoreductase [Anoxybacillus voinovskiensis]